MSDQANHGATRDGDLSAELARVKAEAKQRRIKHRQTQAELERLRAEYEALAQERDGLAQAVQEWEEVRDDLAATHDELQALADWRAEHEPRLEELSGLAAERERLAAEAEALRARLPLEPDEANRRLAEYEARDRRRRLEEAWSGALADVRGPDGQSYALHPDARLETVWRELGVDPDAADPGDGNALSTLAARAREVLPFAFRPLAAAAEPASAAGTRVPATEAVAAPAASRPPAPVAPLAAPRPMPPGPGASRGAPGQDAGGFTVTAAQLRDPVFMREFQKRLDQDPRAREGFRIRSE